ncbi:hypothetical protein [Bythopirellula polymerisocia]|uniref:Uncharacterized protein n=1 Tax=Bythopirellula polymerisocia TaxID=2528003 RepID=A0A5C6CB47_9BACT|nr:hypothetical protein [Bythopirellula polymerisocia]TWU21315.1 hypothetical protein Pla144_47250 [Bythopirellula polymerisocia]
MEMKWPNVAAFALAIIAFFTAVNMHEDISAFFGMMRHLGSNSSISNRTHGLMAFGLILVALMGVLRILLNSQNRKP